MANNASRMIIFRSPVTLKLLSQSPATPRWLSTAEAVAVETESRGKDRSLLYRKLAALSEPNPSVSEILDEWVKEGNRVTKFDITGFVAQLRRFRKHHHAVQLYEWMENTQKKQLANADRAIQIDLLATTAGISTAEDYFEKLEPTAKTKKTYGALLNCYCKEKMTDKAMELFENMKTLNLSSNTLAYNNIMSLHAKNGQPKKILLLVQEMEEKAIKPNVYTYNLLINAYASLNDLESIDGVLEKMKANEVKRDWFTYGNVASVYIDSGLVEKANSILERVEKSQNLSDREAFHTLISLYGRALNRSGVFRAWELLKSAFPKSKNVSYITMLTSLLKIGDLEGLEKVFREWESSCKYHDIKISNVILESYLNRGMIEEAKTVLKTARERMAGPNLRTLDLFMNYYLKEEKFVSALKCLILGASKAKRSEKRFPKEENLALFLKYFDEKNDSENLEKFARCIKKLNCVNERIHDVIIRTHEGDNELSERKYVAWKDTFEKVKEGDVSIDYKDDDGDDFALIFGLKKPATAS